MGEIKLANIIIDRYNLIVGTVVAVLSYIFGQYWMLFAGFLLLNVADWFTGWIKARINKKENSTVGWQGVLKKLGYWVMIAVAFAVSAMLIDIGHVINVDLGVTTALGWIVLSSLIVNEIRSIVENFVEAGFYVPDILIKGLEVANKNVNSNSSEGE